MKKIIEVRKLYDSINHIEFGCIGIEEDSNKIRYFSHYNDLGEYNLNFLYEFNIASPKLKILEYHLANCTIKDSYLNENLPKDLLNIIQDAFKKYKCYNKKVNLPNTFLFKNQLFMIVENEINLENNNRQCNAQYNPYSNSLFFKLEKWQELTDREKEQMENTILHEIGHLKVTQKTLKSNNLYVQCGFNTDEIKLQPILLSNGDVFYKPQKGKNEIYKPEIIIEEIINDFDCSKVSTNFQGNYPSFGSRINNLCDNELQIARYTNGMSVLTSHLLSIIKSKDLLEELLGTLYASVYSYDKWDRQTQEERADQLLLKYEKVKQKKI